jgi:hypothetical protein
MVNDCALSTASKERTYILPLYLLPEDEALQFHEGKRPNLGKEFLRALASALRLKQERPYGTPAGVTPEDIFHYVYAILHSPNYRSRYAEFLKNDFPRLPLTGSLELFRALSQLGGELVALHLLESSKLSQPIAKFVGASDPEIEKVSWSGDTVWLDKAQTTGFRGVGEPVWKFHIGGYRVCEKWLKDRRGRTLSREDIVHYQKIVIALTETIRLMREVDDVIEAYGGWPGAFAQRVVYEAAAEPAALIIDNVAMLHTSPVSEEPIFDSDQADQMLEAAEPEAADYEYEGASMQVRSAQLSKRWREPEGEELICLVRQTFGDGAERKREAAIDELAHALGHQETDSRTDEGLESAIRAAVRRGILESKNGMLKLAAGSIEQYDRAHLKEQFLASISGHRWVDRDDAIRTFARWMGFRRTGASIDETARSLINGLIREARLESDGRQIRRPG